MNKTALKAIVAAVAFAAAGAATAQEKLRFDNGQSGMIFTPRYQPAGNPSEGRCTIRVWVDDRATVIMRGDEIGIRTLSGKTARDEGSFCTGPLPRHATNFRVAQANQVPGGRLVDVDAPSPRNGFTGSATIDDPQNGGRTYVLDVTWNEGAYVPPPSQAYFDSERACQERVRADITARNGRHIDVDFRPNVRKEDMGSGRDRVRGGGVASRRDDSARFGYECIVDDRRDRVISASYEFRSHESTALR
ncbi:hypothetical protein BWI17_16350 [Betaproteobacteria bacterium GR16-43]|nr:hypothetical protein BWI17_16350 [Betaproteobacteria bacterium GR16-43]